MTYVLHSIAPMRPTSNYDTPEAVASLPMDAALTFDGVYRSVYRYRHLLHGRPVVLFVTGHYVGADNSFDEGQPVEHFCSWPQLMEIRKALDCEIGWHTWTHPDLTTLTDNALEVEVTPPWPMRSFAYPYGRFDARVVEAVKAAGYERAYTVGRGDGTQYQLRRTHLRY